MARVYNELRNYQNVPRELVFDNNLSDRARFVYVFMACKPDDWDFYLEPMAKDIGYSVDTLRKYINELVTSGWLIKGEQTNENGVFGAVEYTLKATKKTDTEFFRHGENTTLTNNNNNNEITDNKQEDKKNTKEKGELFETCWKAYRRKGVKKTAKSQWDKLNDEEKSLVLPHIKHYVATREVRYQKDFDRYLRDKLFNEVVYDKNKVAYDPQKALSNEYMPQGHNVYYDELRKFYYYTGFYMKSNDIFDGYNDEDRPDGAKLCLNNARGVIQWNANKKEWIKV